MDGAGTTRTRLELASPTIVDFHPSEIRDQDSLFGLLERDPQDAEEPDGQATEKRRRTFHGFDCQSFS